MIKILIIGANGVLGAALMRYFTVCEYSVLGVIRGGSEIHENVTKYTNYSEFISIIERFKPDFIINAAGKYNGSFNELLEANVKLAYHLIEAVEKSTSSSKILLIGSAAEYGVRSEDKIIGEDDIEMPTSLYGLTKLWQTQLGILKSKKGTEIAICRIFNIDDNRLSADLLAGKVHAQIQEIKLGNRKNIVLAGGNNFRDYLPMSKVLELLHRVIKRGKSGEIYNIGSGRKIRVNDYIRGKLNEEGIKADIIFVNKTTIDYSIADITKINNL